MKAGQWVMVYEDPLTETMAEGQAQLVKRMADLPGDPEVGYEWWTVRFAGEVETYPRKVRSKNVIK